MIIEEKKNLIQKLKNDKVGIIPTDTIYGLVTKIDNEAGLLKIYNLKKRNLEKKMPILVGNIQQLSKLIIVNEEIKIFLKKLKKPTTIIYSKKPNVLKNSLIWNSSTLAIRLVQWSWLQSILLQTGPLVATSCNETSNPSAIEWEEIKKWENQIDFIFKKQAKQKKASQLIDWKTKKILRNG